MDIMLERLTKRFKPDKPQITERPRQNITHFAFVDDEQLHSIIMQLPEGTTEVMGNFKIGPRGGLILVSIDPSTAKTG